jgi:RNA ligase (TIGR02306 family)
MSEHSVNVVEIAEVRPHDNAERLEIVPVGGWQAVVKKGQFVPGDRAVYIEPDYTVPTTRPEFAFLAKEGRDRHRLKAVRLRGVLSFGLLIPLPAELSDRAPGDDVMTALDITRYEPAIKLAKADDLPEVEWPKVYASKFDVESLQRFSDVLTPGEPVIVTEKIHGANARFLWSAGVFYVGSRTRWLKPDAGHPWSRAAAADPRIRAWCETHPDVVLYGEIYGPVQSLKYGSANEVRFAAFAASERGQWWDVDRLLGDEAIPSAPVLWRGPYDPGAILPLAEHDSAVDGAEPGHMREGLVIVPTQERRHEKIGRVALKYVSNRYWESAA